MIRTVMMMAAMALSAPAFACSGDANCDKSHCKMKAKAEIEAALAVVDKADGDKVGFEVDGMTCGSCADKVTAALKALDGVHEAAVSVQGSAARVAYDAGKVDLDKMLAAVNAAGFKAKKLEG